MRWRLPSRPGRVRAAADQAAWRRSASIITAHLADKIISVVTVTAPDRYAAVAVARAVVADTLNARPCHPATQHTTVPSILPSPQPDRKQPSAYWLFVV